jgi:hypothetical protein
MDDAQQQGWVYILRNPSIPNMVKIGSTFNDPAERARQLSVATGVPTPFFVVCAFPTKWAREAEEYIHGDHRWCRVSPNREFGSDRPFGHPYAAGVALSVAEGRFCAGRGSSGIRSRSHSNTGSGFDPKNRSAAVVPSGRSTT